MKNKYYPKISLIVLFLVLSLTAGFCIASFVPPASAAENADSSHVKSHCGPDNEAKSDAPGSDPVCCQADNLFLQASLSDNLTRLSSLPVIISIELDNILQVASVPVIDDRSGSAPPSTLALANIFLKE